MMNITVKKNILVGLVVFIMAIFALSYLSLRLPSMMTIHGPVRVTSDGWGVENDWTWYRPLAVRKIRLAGLPVSVQQPGRVITVTGRIVTRSRVDWGTSIIPMSVNGEQLVKNKFGETVPESLANSNVSQAQLHDQQVAEEQYQRVWVPILAAAKVTTPFTYSGLTFAVPENMKQETIGSAIIFTFPVDFTEAPYISFSTGTKTADQLIAEKKSQLSQFETVVQDTKKTIHGIEWRIFEQTTDFGINQVSWITQRSATTIVGFTGSSDDVEAVFHAILTSATPVK